MLNVHREYTDSWWSVLYFSIDMSPHSESVIVTHRTGIHLPVVLVVDGDVDVVLVTEDELLGLWLPPVGHREAVGGRHADRGGLQHVSVGVLHQELI